MSNGGISRRNDLNWLGMEAPRYTSYPTAHHFSPRVDGAVYRAWLGELSHDATVSLYAHIPFCRDLCWFCGCHTKATKRNAPIAAYVRTLLEEIALVKSGLNGRGRLANLHFGGGSPSLLETGDLEEIVGAVASAFEHKLPGEWSIELDPRTTVPENVARYAEFGFNRVSIGIQDFNPEVQRAINRMQPYPMVLALVRRLREAGIHRINGDLIYGLPLQTPKRFRETLNRVIGLGLSRIALFSYAHVPEIKKHQRLIDTSLLPSETAKLDLYTQARERLEAAGYVAIGIDHFARPDDALAIAMTEGTLRRNFQGYVTETTDALIGIGSSAISQLPQGYAQNTTQAQDYRHGVENGTFPVVRGWAFRDDDLIRKQVIDALMCFMRVDLAAVRAYWGLDDDYFRHEIAELRGPEYRGIVSCENGTVRLNTPYRMAARVVAAVFDRYRGTETARYSKVA